MDNLDLYLDQADLDIRVSDVFDDKCLEAAIQRCSENMHQIYRRAPMRRCDFNQVTK